MTMSVQCPDCGAVASYGQEIGHKSDCPSLKKPFNFKTLRRLAPEEVATIPVEKPDPDYIRRNTQWSEKMTMEDQVRQALARGYCHPDNASKELDSKLIEAMTEEVVKTLTPDVQPGHQ
jgi:hypothetical protein